MKESVLSLIQKRAIKLCLVEGDIPMGGNEREQKLIN